MSYYSSYERPWIDPVETVDDFIEAIITSLLYWYDIHFEAEDGRMSGLPMKILSTHSSKTKV